MRIIISCIFIGLILFGCSGQGQTSSQPTTPPLTQPPPTQPQPKDCGSNYESCLLPAERSCELAYGKLTIGDSIILERILGFEGNKCKTEMNYESPDYKGLSAKCLIPKDMLSQVDRASDDFLCKYCTGTIMDKFVCV